MCFDVPKEFRVPDEIGDMTRSLEMDMTRSLEMVSKKFRLRTL